MTGRRSTGLLGLALAAAIAAGALAALLKEPAVPDVSPGNVAIRAETVADIDPATFQRDLLEQLVKDSAVADPDRLPTLPMFVSLFSTRPKEYGWVLDRLGRAEVPPDLRVAFARRLPGGRSSQDAAADGLLGRILENGPETHRRKALDSLRSRGRVAMTTSSACRCAFGVFPRDPEPAEPLVVFARGADDGVGLAWAPTPLIEGGGWRLDVRPDPDGPSVLARKLPQGGPVRVVGHESSSEAVEVRPRDSL